MRKTLPFPVVKTTRGDNTGRPQLEPKPRKGKGITELHRAVINDDYARLTELLQQRPSRQLSILTILGETDRRISMTRMNLGGLRCTGL